MDPKNAENAEETEEQVAADESYDVLEGEDREPRGRRTETVVDQLDEIDPGSPDPR